MTRGIRYARAERFGLPVLEPLGRDRLASPAPQQGREGSEDCLHLTVWSPQGSRALPVILWIHGGAHVSGSAAEPVTDGARLAATQDIVVVAVQYRLGALGHLAVGDAIEGGEDAGNAALHDQIAALRWVRMHIGAFGGDPDTVTVMGQSSGGVDVLALLAGASGEALFHRAIAHSCTAERVLTPAQAGKVRKQLLRAAGIPSAASLRGLSVDALVRAQTDLVARLSSSAAIDSLPFRPVVDHRLLHRPPVEAFREGVGGEIPLLIGSNRREALPWMGEERDEADALDSLLGAVAPGLQADDLIAPYRSDRGCAPTARELREAVLSEVMYRSPVQRVLAGRRGSATFGYVFDPHGFDDIDPGHSGELPFVFGTASGRSSEAHLLSLRMMDAWGAFARDGRPSTEPGWLSSEHGVFHWGAGPRLLAASDPCLRAALTAAGAGSDRL